MTQTAIIVFNSLNQKRTTKIRIDNPTNRNRLGTAHALKVLTYVPKTSLKDTAMAIRTIEKQTPDKKVTIIVYTCNDPDELAQLSIAIRDSKENMEIISLREKRSSASSIGRGRYINTKAMIALIGSSPLTDTELICKLSTRETACFDHENFRLFKSEKKEKPTKKFRKAENRRQSQLAKHGKHMMNHPR